MDHRTTPDFWQQYDSLPVEVRSRANKQFALLKDNPLRPSLQFKKVGERHGIELWPARVTLSYRALAIKRPDGYLWFWIGDHEAYDLLVSQP